MYIKKLKQNMVSKWSSKFSRESLTFIRHCSKMKRFRGKAQLVKFLQAEQKDGAWSEISVVTGSVRVVAQLIACHSSSRDPGDNVSTKIVVDIIILAWWRPRGSQSRGSEIFGTARYFRTTVTLNEFQKCLNFFPLIGKKYIFPRWATYSTSYMK